MDRKMDVGTGRGARGGVLGGMWEKVLLCGRWCMWHQGNMAAPKGETCKWPRWMAEAGTAILLVRLMQGGQILGDLISPVNIMDMGMGLTLNWQGFDGVVLA